VPGSTHSAVASARSSNALERLAATRPLAL
jgi:hypothetical protein